MLNERIDHFSFWQPVVFTLADNPGTTKFSKYLWVIGSLADQYASLSQKSLYVEAERIDAHKVYFETKDIKNVSIWITALKATSYVFSLGTLFVAALVIKMIFKSTLNHCRALTKTSPNEFIVEKQVGNSKIILLFGSVTDETTDVIVNAANNHLWAGDGVCGAIYRDAGDVPFGECEEILKKQKRKKLDIGEAVLTSAGDLAPRVKAIVHAVGPDCRQKKQKENGTNLLTAAYQNSLELAHHLDQKPDFVSSDFKGPHLHSIAFPSISTGIYKFPLDEAAAIAIETIANYLIENEGAFDEVRIVCLPLNKDPNTAPAYQKALESLEISEDKD